MRKFIVYFCLTVFLSSCARRCQELKRSTGTRRNYEVILFSCGDTVFIDHPKNIVIGQEGGDGIFYYKGDTLIEIAGTYLIKSEK